MSKEIKNFKDVENELETLRRDFVKEMEQKRINNIALGMITVKGSITNAFKDEEVKILNTLIKQFNKLLINIQGQ